MEKVMASLANYFATNSKDEIHLILYGKPHEIFYDIHTLVIIHKPHFAFNTKYRRINTIKTACFIRSTIRKIRPITILSFGHIWNSLVMLSLLGIKKKIFLSDRAQPDLPISFVYQKLRKYLYPKATGIIAQTIYAKDFFQRWMPYNNIRVIANPIHEVPQTMLGQRQNIILSVGRLIKTKHHDKLINIFNQINNSDWQLIIVGGDAEKQNIHELLNLQINALDLQQRVLLTGEVQNVIPYYIQANIFAFTSSTEGFPNALAEAMAHGCACISYDCIAGPADLIDDGVNGFLIPEGNEKLYIEKLRLLMEDADLRKQFGLAAREKMKQFSTDKIAQQYLDFILA
ncbi:MAG: glycosyltransferase [Bacteroidetes bacterium]|nr:glycosyltransferase [Bacteroidota bacterium]